jgi:hypothetical protein
VTAEEITRLRQDHSDTGALTPTEHILYEIAIQLALLNKHIRAWLPGPVDPDREDQNTWKSAGLCGAGTARP